MAHSQAALKDLTNSFAVVARQFGLTISRKKTELMYQPAPQQPYHDLSINLEGTTLQAVKQFTYLSSVMNNEATNDHERERASSTHSLSITKSRARRSQSTDKKQSS